MLCNIYRKLVSLLISEKINLLYLNKGDYRLNGSCASVRKDENGFFNIYIMRELGNNSDINVYYEGSSDFHQRAINIFLETNPSPLIDIILIAHELGHALDSKYDKSVQRDKVIDYLMKKKKRIPTGLAMNYIQDEIRAWIIGAKKLFGLKFLHWCKFIEISCKSIFTYICRIMHYSCDF